MNRPAVIAVGILATGALLVLAWSMRPDQRQSLAVGPGDVHGQDTSDVPVGESPLLETVGEPRVSVSLASVPAAPAPIAPVPVPLTTIKGTVVTETGEAIEGAEVTTRIETDSDEEPPELKAISDAEGAFTLEGREPSGTYWVNAKWKAGWFLVAPIECTPQVSECKLVFRQGGGIRGKVIEALDSTVEDYIVVVSYEQPPVEWTPERVAHVKRLLDREMRKKMREDRFNWMRTQLLMQELGIKSERRPDGEAWTLLDPDGSFEVNNVRSGKSSVIIAARNRTRGLVTVRSVDVQPGVVGEDARLNPVCMNEHACVYRIAIAGPDGAPVIAGMLDVLPVEKDGHGKFAIEFKDGAATFIGPLWIDRVTITAQGFQSLIVRGPEQSMRATLQKE